MKNPVRFRVKICQSDVFIFGFLKFLFPVCFFCFDLLFVGVDYQCITFNQQILKKKITVVDGACVFFVAAAQVQPLFLNLTYHSFDRDTLSQQRTTILSNHLSLV